MNKQEATIELAVRALEKRHEQYRLSFKKYVLKMFEEEKKKTFEWNWHFDAELKAIQELLDDDNQQLLIINIPPRHGKTEIVTKLFPTWYMGNNPDKEIISTGYSSTLTQGFSAEARDYIQSDTYKKIFPRVMVKKDSNSKEHWKLTGGGSYYATGTGGTITGKGADLFVVDDPLNPNDAESGSQTNLLKVNTWFQNVALSRLNNKIIDGKLVKGKMVIIMQRLHDNDLCGYILREFKHKFVDGSYKALILPALATTDEQHRKKGEALFPRLYPKHYLTDKKASMMGEGGQNHFSAQYQQDPVDAENAEFKRDYFRYFDEDILENRPLNTILAVDPAISEKQSADYSALVTVSRDLENNYFVRNTSYGQISPSDLVDRIFELQSLFKCPVALETVGFQKIIADNVRKEMKVRGQIFQIIEISQRGEKNARMRATLQPLYSNYKILHPRCEEHKEMEDEILRFPKARRDDLMDALETAVSCLKAPNNVIKQSARRIILPTRSSFN